MTGPSDRGATPWPGFADPALPKRKGPVSCLTGPLKLLPEVYGRPYLMSCTYGTFFISHLPVFRS